MFNKALVLFLILLTQASFAQSYLEIQKHFEQGKVFDPRDYINATFTCQKRLPPQSSTPDEVYQLNVIQNKSGDIYLAHSSEVKYLYDSRWNGRPVKVNDREVYSPIHLEMDGFGSSGGLSYYKVTSDLFESWRLWNGKLILERSGWHHGRAPRMIGKKRNPRSSVVPQNGFLEEKWVVYFYSECELSSTQASPASLEL